MRSLPSLARRRSFPRGMIRAIRCALGSMFFVSVASAAEPNPGLRPAPDRAWVTRLFDGMRAPIPPRTLVSNIHYVGAVNVSSFLITTPAGHILLDTGFDGTVTNLQRSVEQLGFRVADIKFILSTHAHVDHVGGHAIMKKLTGAQVLASAADARTLESGGADDFIPWPKDTILFKPVKVDRIVGDGEQLTLGGVTLTAHLTPGHTRGATTWTMDVTERGEVRHVVFFSSTTVNDGVRLLNNPLYPDLVSAYEATFAKLRRLPCDIFFGGHGTQFAMTAKFARLDRGEAASPFIDPTGWKSLLSATPPESRDREA